VVANPQVAVADERADEIRDEPRHLAGDAGAFGGGELAPVREHHEAAHDGEAEPDGNELGAGYERDGIPDEPDERVRAHAAEGILGVPGLVLLALEPNQEGEGEHQRYLDRVDGDVAEQQLQGVASLGPRIRQRHRRAPASASERERGP
jgi:hypothetical protein